VSLAQTWFPLSIANVNLLAIAVRLMCFSNGPIPSAMPPEHVNDDHDCPSFFAWPPVMAKNFPLLKKMLIL